MSATIRERMIEWVQPWLDSLVGSAMRNRHHSRKLHQLMTELSRIKLSLPRTKRPFPSAAMERYAWPTPEFLCAIQVGCVLGLSTRVAGEARLAMLGRKILFASARRGADSVVTTRPEPVACLRNELGDVLTGLRHLRPILFEHQEIRA